MVRKEKVLHLQSGNYHEGIEGGRAATTRKSFCSTWRREERWWCQKRVCLRWSSATCSTSKCTLWCLRWSASLTRVDVLTLVQWSSVQWSHAKLHAGGQLEPHRAQLYDARCKPATNPATCLPASAAHATTHATAYAAAYAVAYATTHVTTYVATYAIAYAALGPLVSAHATITTTYDDAECTRPSRCE